MPPPSRRVLVDRAVSAVLVAGAAAALYALAPATDYRAATRAALAYIVVAVAAPHAIVLACTTPP
jgi:hypothetical protein